MAISGPDCGALDASTPECIKQGNGCDILLVSKPGGGAMLGTGVDGTASLDLSGDFKTPVPLTEGGILRSGCTGVWNASAQQLVVDCGGDGGQACIVTMTRENGTCAF